MDRKILRGFLILFWVAVLAFFQPPHGEAGIFGGYIPEGQEVKDSYLEKLFEPEYPYEWIRIIDTKEGKRFVIIKAKQKITEEMEKAYQEKTLRGRNIAIYRYHSPRTGNLILAKIRLSQKVSDRPYVIEYCQANPWKMQDKEKDIAWREGKYFIVWIDRNFGKQFKKLVIYPEKEEDCPPAPAHPSNSVNGLIPHRVPPCANRGTYLSIHGIPRLPPLASPSANCARSFYQ